MASVQYRSAPLPGRPARRTTTRLPAPPAVRRATSTEPALTYQSPWRTTGSQPAGSRSSELYPLFHTAPGARRHRRSPGYESAIAEEDSEDWDREASTESVGSDSEVELPFFTPSITSSIAGSSNDTVNQTVQPKSPRNPSTGTLQSGPGFEVYNVEFSWYLDDEYGTGEVRAEIQHTPLPATTSDKVGPLFRWIHLKQDIMDFDAFQSTAKALPDLSEDERGSISRLLQRAQRQAQKPFRTKDGPRGRVLGPVALSKEMPNKILDTEENYYFYSLPYFCLKRYVGVDIAENSSLQPTRALMQTRDPSTPKARDLDQAVCQLSGTPTGHCFHISTLWCLVIQHKYVLTCSLHSGTELSGESLDILKCPPSQPAMSARDRSQVLRVIHQTTLYLIPINECDSWFKFTQKFSALHNKFDDLYSVYWNGRRVESSQWHMVIRQARKSAMQTQIVVSRRQHMLNRPFNKPRLGVDDGVEVALASSRPVTPNRSGSITSVKGLRTTDSIQEEDEDVSPIRGRTHESAIGLKVPLSPGLGAPDPLRRPPSASIVSLEHYLQDFHALRWIAVKSTEHSNIETLTDSQIEVPRISQPEASRPRKSYDERVDSYLNELHKHMQVKLGASGMKYQTCVTKSLKEVERTLAGIVRGGLDNPTSVSLKQDIVTAAKSIFTIILPLDQGGIMVLKYWGAVRASIAAPMTQNLRQLQGTIQILMRVARTSIDMQAQLSRGKGPDPTETDLPVEFVKAWLALLTCQLNFAQDTIAIARKQALKCRRYLDKAINIVMTKFEGKRLPELRSLLPAELSVFLVHRVMQDMVGDLPGVSESYWEYFTHLESVITKYPLSRAHHAKLSALLEELDIIEEHLDKQLKVTLDLQYGPLRERAHEKFDGFVFRYHFKLLNQSIDSASGTRSSLLERRRQIGHLQNASSAYATSNKEQQERAIYVFTIVTIIFLPISTVSSIFGMNVQDVRNMENGQWVFWAVAVPVTAIVIVASLFGAGILSVSGERSTTLPTLPYGMPPLTSAYDYPQPPPEPLRPLLSPDSAPGLPRRRMRRSQESIDL